MRKPFLLFGLAGVAVALLAYTLVDAFIEPTGNAALSSVTANYESLKACEKQNILWQQVEASAYKELPDFRKLGVLQLLALAKQEIGLKGSHYSDFAPVGWKKFLHGRGAIAKVRIAAKNNAYTGVFQGAECGLLRLSLTSKVSGDRPVAPGLAFKVLRDSAHSANISALVSLEGQAKDFNFFKYPMSNIVPIGTDLGQRMVHKIFSKASKFPEELMPTDMAAIDAHGEQTKNVVAPRQIFFMPNENLNFSSAEHDVRSDFLTIPEGTVLYHLYLVSDKYKNFDYTNYRAENISWVLDGAQHVADIVTTSKFVASQFGDDGIFFRHQLRE